MYTEMRVDAFLDALASKEPVPGGGSSAALGGALGAALTSMVCNLTIGKKGYEDVQDAMVDLLETSESLRRELVALLEADTQVYGKLMAVYRQSHKTPEQKRERKARLQAAYKEAAEVPLAIAECCARIVDLTLPAAEMGNRWLVSDAGVGVLLAEACLQGALLNVYINLSSIKDETYAEQVRERIEAMTEGSASTKERVMTIVREKIGA